LNNDYTNFTLTVINVNDGPVIITNDILIINEDKLYEIDYEALDVDTPQNNLNWFMNTNASWLEFDQKSGTLSGIPENKDVGEYRVNISVSDAEYEDFSNFTLKVINVNDSPKIITKDNNTAIEDMLYKNVYEAEDVDNVLNELIWSINTNANWLNYSTIDSIIYGTPTNNDVGDHWINVSVSDAEYIDYSNFTLTVVNTNDPPVITTEDKTNAVIGDLYSVNYEAEDIDPSEDKLIWSLITDAGDWLTIDTTTGWLNGVPSNNDFGIYLVNISVTDDENGWDYHNFTLQVSIKNNAPELYNFSITPSDGDTNTEFIFSVNYYDADGDAPEFIHVVIGDAAYNMKLKPGENSSNGIYEFRTTLPEGMYDYYFTVTDGFDIVKTDNSTTPEIKKVDKSSTERISWYWLILIVIIVVIIASLLFLVVFKRRKALRIPTVRAELLQTTPSHLTLPGETSRINGSAQLQATQSKVLDQLPTPVVEAQPSIPATTEKAPVPSLAPAPVTTQFQLPQATLTKAQQLHLLRERFLKGEVTEETYNKLRAEIEGQNGEDITMDDSEETTDIGDSQPSEGKQQTESSQQSETTQQPEAIFSTESQPQPQLFQQEPAVQTQPQEKSEENNDSQLTTEAQKPKVTQEGKD
jgi:hypothetical protein